MKILYIGDNRDRVNWGCRATSKALRTLIEANNEISGTIDGKEVASYSMSPTVYSKFISVKLYVYLVRRKGRFPFSFALNIIRKFGLVEDYLSDDIDGSIAFFEANNKYFPHLKTINQHINECDGIVINGEGDMIFTTPTRRSALFYIFIIKLVKKRGKSIFYLNSMVSDCPKTGRNQVTLNSSIDSFKLCDLVTTRDQTSFDFLNSLNENINLKFIPDALFTWQSYFKDGIDLPKIGDSIIPFPEMDMYFGKFDFTQPYIVISGSSSASWTPETAILNYSKMVIRIKEIGLRVYLVPTCGGDGFLQSVARNTDTSILPVNLPIVMGASILANASVMISGRFHPSILASLGGTPCVFLGSNSHKTLSIQNLLDYEEVKEYSSIPCLSEIEDIKRDAIVKINMGNELRTRIISTVIKRAEEASVLMDLID